LANECANGHTLTPDSPRNEQKDYICNSPPEKMILVIPR